MKDGTDRWHRWLTDVRHGGDAAGAAAAAEGALQRCSFVPGSADALTGVADSSADVVTTRSVLIYVKDKAAALREFYAC
jgi:arsenite methyltransferase